MRKLRFAGVVAALLLVTAAFGFADKHGPSSLIGVNPVGPVLGVYSASYESAIDDTWSWFIEGRYINPRLSLLMLVFDLGDDWSLWYLGAAGGANYSLSGTVLEGAFIGGYATAGYGQVDVNTKDTTAALSGMVLGGGVRLGYRITWGIISIAPQISAGYSYAFIDGVTDKEINDGRGADGEDPKINISALSGLSLGFGLGLAIALP